MTARRRKWIIVATVVLLAGAAVWSATRNGGKIEVKLHFVGWTNEPYPITFGVFIRPDEAEKMRAALILVTNTGEATVMVHSSMRIEHMVTRTNFASPDHRIPPTRLKPGTGFILVTTTFDYHQPWFTELLVRRAGWNEKTIDPNADPLFFDHAAVNKRFTSPPPGQWVRVGPITNKPSAREGLVYPSPSAAR